MAADRGVGGEGPRVSRSSLVKGCRRWCGVGGRQVDPRVGSAGPEMVSWQDQRVGAGGWSSLPGGSPGSPTRTVLLGAGAPGPGRPSSEAPPYLNIPVSPSSKTQLLYLGLELQGAGAGIRGASPWVGGLPPGAGGPGPPFSALAELCPLGRGPLPSSLPSTPRLASQIPSPLPA